MPGYTPSSGALMAKFVSLFPHNAGGPDAPGPHHRLRPATGRADRPAGRRGHHRPAHRRGSACATRLLAREDARTLAILGTGVQARAHAQALPRVRAFTEVRIAGRDPRKAAALAAEIGATAVGSFAEACDGADVVCATTHADEPVVRREQLSPGTHVTSVGYNPTGREVDDATVQDALVAVESRASALAPVPAGSPDLATADPDARRRDRRAARRAAQGPHVTRRS